MKSKTEQLLKIMHVLAWIVFIGLLIKVGTIIITYFISIGNEEASKNLFDGLNLWDYRNHSFTQYSLILGYKVLLYAAEAHIAYLIIQLLSKLNLEKPFSSRVQDLMQKISYSIFYLWIIAMIHNTHVQFIGMRYNFPIELFSSDFIFLAGIIFIFAQIVKRGIELQSESELTI